jgi:hypothetical protein
MPMDVKKDITRDEALFNAVLNVAFKDAMEREMQEMPSLEALNDMYPVSHALDRRVHQTINRSMRARKTKQAVRIVSKVAAVLCLFVIVGGGVLVSVEASRNFIRNLFVDVREDHVVLDFGEGEVAVSIGDGITFSYMPAKFNLIASHEQELFNIFIYADESGAEIVIEHIFSAFAPIGVDTELRDFSMIMLDGREIFLFESRYSYANNRVLWEYEGGIISVSSTLPMSELKKIAEGFIAK